MSWKINYTCPELFVSKVRFELKRRSEVLGAQISIFLPCVTHLAVSEAGEKGGEGVFHCGFVISAYGTNMEHHSNQMRSLQQALKLITIPKILTKIFANKQRQMPG